MKKCAQIFYVFLILVLMYAPIFTLVLYSFVDAPVVNIQVALSRGFSIQLYKDLFNDSGLMKIVWDTLILALVVAVLATLLGTLGAIGIYYSKGKFSLKIYTNLLQFHPSYIIMYNVCQ